MNELETTRKNEILKVMSATQLMVWVCYIMEKQGR